VRCSAGSVWGVTATTLDEGANDVAVPPAVPRAGPAALTTLVAAASFAPGLSEAIRPPRWGTTSLNRASDGPASRSGGRGDINGCPNRQAANMIAFEKQMPHELVPQATKLPASRRSGAGTEHA